MYLILGTTVAFFHLLALNLLYPKLVGSRVHLNPLVVTVALMFWGASGAAWAWCWPFRSPPASRRFATT